MRLIFVSLSLYTIYFYLCVTVSLKYPCRLCCRCLAVVVVPRLRTSTKATRDPLVVVFVVVVDDVAATV